MVAILINNIINSSNAALIVLFGILSGPSTLLIKNFCIMSFISFADII